MSEYGCRVSKMTPKLKVEAGKYYRDGHGDIRGPAVRNRDPLDEYPWELNSLPIILDRSNQPYGCSYTEGGLLYDELEWSKDNLVKEVPAP